MMDESCGRKVERCFLTGGQLRLVGLFEQIVLASSFLPRWEGWIQWYTELYLLILYNPLIILFQMKYKIY